MISMYVDDLISGCFGREEVATQDSFYTDIPSRGIQATQTPFQLWMRIWRRKDKNIRGVSRSHYKGRLQWYNIRQTKASNSTIWNKDPTFIMGQKVSMGK